MKKKRVAVGLSGGVDSAVSAALLKKQGYDVTGVFLYCFKKTGFPCTVDEDRAMAVKVSNHLGIPIKIIDLRSQYRRSVVDYFFSEYKAGRTPNPDVMCNKEIKFGLFYDKVINDWKMDFVATGHYARIIKNVQCTMNNDGIKRNFLSQGVDKTKDQSYFLYNLTETQLEHILFPIGEYKKDEVRKMAKQFKLPNWDRPDSQGICFIGEVSVRKFLSTKFKVKKGLVVSPKGEVIGEHDGIWFYTIGQRHGFRLSEKLKFKSQKSNEKPLYILGKNSDRNELIVGEKIECFRTQFVMCNTHWINPLVFARSEATKQSALRGKRLLRFARNDNLTVRIRHLGELYRCEIVNLPTMQFLTPNIRLQLLKPAFAVAPGQSAVLYLDDVVLGGGIILS